MTAPEPSTGTQDLAEKVARMWWERATGKTWSPDVADQGPSQQLVVTAYEWIDTMRAAGLAVVELPEPDPDAPAHPTWRDGCGNPWHAQPDGVIDEFGLLVRDVEKLRRTAATLLAACDAVERLRAEHQPALEHDGAGPPVCEPCSADCPACAAERQGGDPR